MYTYTYSYRCVHTIGSLAGEKFVREQKWRTHEERVNEMLKVYIGGIWREYIGGNYNGLGQPI